MAVAHRRAKKAMQDERHEKKRKDDSLSTRAVHVIPFT
jgi:hypothetical protein